MIARALQHAALILSLLYAVGAGAQDSTYVHEVLTTLCSDILAGRGYVEDGDSEAAFFIEKQFKELDLKSWDFNYYQTFFVEVNTFPGKMELKLDGHRLTPGRDYLISPDAPSVSGTFPVTRLDRLPAMAPSGRVIDSTLSLKGAVLMPDSLLGKLPRPLHHEMLKGLKRAGARMVIRSADSKLTWHVSPDQAPLAEFIIPDSLVPQLLEKVSVQADAKLVRRHRTQNVLAYVPGTSESDSTFVFTAHYDHLGKMGKEAIFRGANDNASGVTMLLALARHFSLPENAPRHNIAFIAFAAEELGLLGSFHYVTDPVFPLKDIVFLFNLDLAGTGEEGIKVVNATVFPRQFERLTAINSALNLLPKVEPRGKAAISDHHPFTEAGVPCFYAYTLGGSPAYHDVNDIPEGLSLAGFKGYFRLLVEFVNGF
jgi:aminopeptidase YwaD